jgi:ketosteroid isomerase-like protein
MPEKSATPGLVERMGEVVEAFNRRDVDALMSFFAADAVFESPVLGTSFDGVAAIRRFAEDWLGAFEEWAVEPQEIIDMGNGIVFVVYRQEGRPVGSSGLVRSQAVSVYEWADGAVARATTYADIDAARAAAERLAKERE